MSEAEFMEDGSDYYAAYNDDCDGDCMNCTYRMECEDSPYIGGGSL
jgi:hypothetical protein